jgi:hypothetical protein
MLPEVDEESSCRVGDDFGAVEWEGRLQLAVGSVDQGQMVREGKLSIWKWPERFALLVLRLLRVK